VIGALVPDGWPMISTSPAVHHVTRSRIMACSNSANMPVI
jgi:hypothetical protein